MDKQEVIREESRTSRLRKAILDVKDASTVAPIQINNLRELRNSVKAGATVTATVLLGDWQANMQLSVPLEVSGDIVEASINKRLHEACAKYRALLITAQDALSAELEALNFKDEGNHDD